MGSLKSFWRFSNHHRSPSSASGNAPMSSITVSEMPVEFLCPISRSLMADPVIVPPSGHTFERSCVQACADLAFSPPGLFLDLSPSSLLLIPNVALKSAILSWCQRCGVPSPQPIPLDAACALIRSIMPPSTNPRPPPPPLLSDPPPHVGGGGGGGSSARRDQRGEFMRQFTAFSLDEAEEAEKGESFGPPREYAYPCDGTERVREDRGDLSRDRGYDEKYEELRASSALPDGKGCRSRINVQNMRETMSPNTPSAFSVRTTNHAPSFSQLSTPSASEHQSSSSNSSITEAFFEQAPKEPPPPTSQVQNPAASNLPASPTADFDLSEEEILIRLMDTELSEQESAVVLLRLATRESRDRRIDLCTPRLLAALRSMLLCSSAAVQINATAALVNLSLELENRVRILRSGAVAPLVDVLKGGHPEARDHAAGALFSLSLEDENRAAIGVLGAIPPLLDLFSVPSADGVRARRDAGMALYYLSLAGSNRLKIARAPGAVRAVLSVALESEEAPVDGAPPPHGPGLARLAMMTVCSLAVCNDGRAALMDGGAVAPVVSLMRSPAAAAVEEYCVAALYGMSRGSLRFRGLARSAGAEPVLMRVAYSGGGGEMRRNMAKKTLRAMRGEDDTDAPPPMGFPVGDDGSVVSEGLKSFRGRPNHHANPSRMNSAGF
ncbi:U-box domain-containing protein 40 [Musa acuminata AAA Group]|uniref:U-box domain-containing protein 40 n=1 Tax=Musa acuminata AAA Group TaxID=214697 RepID=UPI0031D99E2E